MFTEEDILKKISLWEFEENLSNNDSLQAKVYVQLQTHLKNIYDNVNDIKRIKTMLEKLVQDFKSESKKAEKVAVFLRTGSENQAKDIKNSMSLIDNFSGKISAIYEKTQGIISLAYEMEKLNQNIQTSIDELVVNQEKNNEVMQDIFGVIKNLIIRTEKIGEVTKLINRISNETNLLGLNAKVEAVHAGQYGRGFSVVADEIQRLSKESKEASGNISDTIKNITEEIGLLEKFTLKSKETFSAQSDSVSDVNNTSKKNSDFIGKYIKEQGSFYKAIEEIKNEEGVLVDMISNVFSSVRDVSATAQEISSLNYNQNNSIALLNKLNTDLSNDVSSVNERLEQIHILPDVIKRRRVAIVFENENSFWEPLKQEAIKAAGVYDYEVIFFAPKNRGVQGIKEMADILDKIIKEKYDGLVLSPISDPLIFERLRALNKIGTKIVFINSKIDNIDYVSLIHTDGIMTGIVVAHIVMGILGNRGEVIVNSWTDAQLSVVENRRVGFIQELKNNSKISVHEVGVPSKPSEKEAEIIIGSIFQSFLEAKVVFLTNFDWGLLFASYKKRHNMDVQIIVVDYIDEVEKALKAGQIDYAIGQRAYSWGTMAIGFIEDSFLNKPVPKIVDTGTFEVNQQTIKIYTDI